MLHDDAILLTYGISDRLPISMFPAMKISRFMVNKMVAFKGIIFRQSGICLLYTSDAADD